MPSRYLPRYKKGDHIGGRYLVHQALLGGMGEVYLCLDEEERIPIALKTFQGSDLSMKENFKGEVEKWIGLERHPNIVRCHAMDNIDNIPFMMLEWIASDKSKGTDLRSWLRNGPLSLELTLGFTIDIVRGLKRAGEKSPGIVHRDLKPDNVLVNQNRQAKITDFGLATVVQRSDLSFESADISTSGLGHSMRVGNIVGTPPYMPPEQWQGKSKIDVRTDLYAVGCIFYEMLTGRWLYSGSTINELQTQHTDAPIPKLVGEFPEAINNFLQTCVAKHFEQRFYNPSQALEQLYQIYEQHTNKSYVEITVEEFTGSDYNNRALTYSNLGENERAIQDYNEAIHLNPDDPIAYSNRGASYSNLGQYELAIQDFNTAIQLNSNYALAYFNRGSHYGILEKYEQAIQDFNDAIRIDPNFAHAYLNRGIYYTALGQFESAIADLETSVKLDPKEAKAYYNRGLNYAYLGHYEQAIQDFDHAIQVDSSYSQAFCNRGLSYLNLGQVERAIQDFDSAIHLDPNFAIAYSNRGLSYLNLGQVERATQDYDEAIHIDPNFAHAYFGKGFILANNDKLKESLPLFEKAYSLGLQEAADVIQQVHQMLGMSLHQENPNSSQYAFEAFQQANSIVAMREALSQHPVLAQMIPSIEQVIEQQVPPESRPDFLTRLGWLRQLVVQNSQQDVMRQLVGLYQQQGEAGLRQVLAQQGVPAGQVDELISVVKHIVSGE